MYDDTDPSIPLVQLIGGLSLQYGGRRMALPSGGHRLLAYLALHPSGVDRRSSAEVLWPTVDDGRAAGNLRSALWRLQQVGCPLVRAGESTVALREGVDVDLARFEAWADRILSGAAGPADVAVDAEPIGELELLPGWHDDWVLAARDRLHQRRLHALERLGAETLPRSTDPAARTALLQEPATSRRAAASRWTPQATVSVRAPLAPLEPVARRAAAARIARAPLCRSVSARYT
jgi:DNA-binding SARP family transcriptional activator